MTSGISGDLSFPLNEQTRRRVLKAQLVCSAFFGGCYFRGGFVNLAFAAVVDLGFGYERIPLQRGGFGCLGRLNTGDEVFVYGYEFEPSAVD